MSVTNQADIGNKVNIQAGLVLTTSSRSWKANACRAGKCIAHPQVTFGKGSAAGKDNRLIA
jgi:hypothetical protein